MDYYQQQYEELFQKLKKQVPFMAAPIRELVQIIRSQHPITLSSQLTVSDLYNSGDISGIVCTVSEHDNAVFVCSLTHLIFEPGFPLYKEVLDYQKKRAKRIAKLNAG